MAGDKLKRQRGSNSPPGDTGPGISDCPTGTVADTADRKQTEQALIDAQVAVEMAMEGISKLDDNGRYIFVNQQYAALLGYRPEELVGRTWEMTVHPQDHPTVLSAFSRMLVRGKAEVELRGCRKDGNLIYKQVVIVKSESPDGERSGHFCFVRDVTERKREEALQKIERDALELVAKGTGLKEVLTNLCRSIEDLAEPMLCSVMLVSNDGTGLGFGAGPSLPEEYTRLLNGIPIGPAAGSCGTSAYHGIPIIVEDISRHPLWASCADVVLPHGLRACWSQPIIGATRKVLGTFAAYYREPRAPQESDLKLVERVSHIAALAVEHAQMTEALQETEARFQAFMQHSPAVKFIKDGSGRYLYANPAFETVVGRSWENIKSRTVFDFLPVDVAQRLHQQDQTVHSNGQPLEIEETIPTPEGSTRRWLINKFPLDVGQRRLLGGVAFDLTERRCEEERLLRTQFAMDQAVDAVYWIDPQARILYTNEAASTMLGYTADEFLRMTVHDLNPDFPAEIWPGWWEEVREKKVVSLETNHLTKDRRLIPIDIRVSFLAYGGQEFHCAYVRDISKRKEVEEAAHRSFNLLQSVLHTTPIRVFWKDRESRFLGCNQNFAIDAGCANVQEIVGKTDAELSWRSQTALYQADDRQVMESGRAKLDFEEPGTTRDGKPVWLRTSKVPLRDEEGSVIGVLGVYEDITGRKRVDEALRASQERFELAARASNDGIWDWDILTGEQYWSDRHLELLGLQRNAFTPTYDSWISLVHPDDAEWVRQATSHHLETREPYDIEVRVRMQDGRYRWFRDRGQAVWDPSGHPVRMVGSISDVTERRNAEEAIWKAHAELEQRVHERTRELAMANRSLQQEIVERKKVEDRLQRTQYAVDQAADQIFVISSNGYFLDVNEAACRRLGYTKDELLTMSVMDIDPDFSSEVWTAFWEEFSNSRRIRLETKHRSKSGEVYPVEVVANYLSHEGRELDCAIVRDISERKQAEEIIRESELRYKLLTDTTFDGVALHEEGVLFEVNPGLGQMFGYGPDELIGRSILDLVADESRDLVVANMRDGVSGPYEVMGRRKDGSTFPGEVVVRPHVYRGRQVRLVAGRDITARKQLEVERARYTEELERQVAERTAELAKLESQRVQAEKLAAMGRLAAGVAHEINNPLAGIKNAFALVKQVVDPTHPHAEFADMIDREIARVTSIVQNMYQLYRPESGRAEPIELPTMIKDIQALFAKRLEQRRLVFSIDVDPRPPQLSVSRGDLLQILLNLLNNAIDCSGDGSVITLSLCVEQDVIRIAVSDQGPGIPPEILPHIFDPFYTTKTGNEPKGMGLGLSVSQSLVAAMGGRIEVETQLNKGSRFSVLLPKDTGAASRPYRSESTEEAVKHER